ncbi:fumarylacetoacetate hydrolase family protein [Paenibacillus sp. PAMC21692]|uniref:fumarylacetoacetate hydrolase family protein n=1 Tax=Paenibacillus sp. PAMC21692 TaxID=2762320 RepID=UPI00164DAE9C|nr:fumarylacetoacetate hydrolase family protein [Paenibacillus sp. PAMC21692]QNK55888.1 fumarylacetoacetate hydrolase family protein [Paenibacillus sp. PAMC21692]
MRLIQYLDGDRNALAAVGDNEVAYRLQDKDVWELFRRAQRLGMTTLEAIAADITEKMPLQGDWRSLELLPPVDAPEVWAAGVTYQRSREARNYEATGGKANAGATFYDLVYDAERPELFFKSTSARTVGPGGTVKLRSDSTWQVPEPELGLVLNAAGDIVAYTIGNDMSCRDIEGENPLYLPQAKIWRQSCSVGPAIRLAETTANPYDLEMKLRIYRNEEIVVDIAANTGMLKRKLEELVSYLKRDNLLFDGTVLLTGTCLVPPDDFTLQPNDRIEIEIKSIGTLVNTVVA